MFIDIDYDKRKKGYKINLAKPNQQTIASISEAYGANYSIKLGNINEVTFNVPYFIDKLDERVKNENIELIKEKMYTKISYNNNDEWMVIDTIEDVGSGDEKYMTVTAFTNVYETSNRKINELNLEVVNPEEYYNAVLNDVAWSIGTIDPLFKDIYRSVELNNVTVLEAIITGAETFGAVLDFDTENKKINLIDMDSRAKYRGLNINYSNFLQSINRKRSVDEMTTRLYVYGSEDLSIENVNPTGMRYLEDFTYFLYPFERDENKSVIKSSHYMSDELAHAILDKNELSEEYQPQIKAMQEEIDGKTIEYINETTLLNELKFDETSVSGLLDIAKATEDNDLILQRQSELAEIKTKISIKELTVDHISATIEDLERQITQLQSQISVTSFSKELYDELSMYIIESEFRDDRYIDEEELYRDALKKFDESKSPSVVIEASIDNIIDSLEEDYYSDKVVLGDIARVTDKEMNVEMKSLITELSFDLDNNTCDVTIANGDIEKDGYDRILSVLYDTQSTTTMLENNKYKWDTVTDVKTEVDLMRDGEIDATRNRIKAGFRESVTIEDRGIILSNPDFPNEIVIMQAGVIALSMDGGENWSTSITPRGVMADTIIGKLVASNNLIVTNDSGSFRIDGEGLTVDMDSIKIMSGEGDTPENIVDSWNEMLITMDEFADDGKLNEYEKNQIARQWNSIAIAHSSMVDAIQNAYGPETPENPYPAEYEVYMESYERLRSYLNDEIQSDGHTILDPLHRSETTNIDSDKYNRLVSDYEVNKDRFQTVIPLEFSQTFMEQTRKEISLNYVKNGEVATKLNLSEEGVRIDGRLLEINSETHFNDDLVMNAGLIRSADGAINIDLNAGIINLSRPLTINAVPVATEEYVEENLADAIKNIDVEYGITSDKNTPPTDWNTAPPAWQDGKYIWSRTLTVYKNGRTEITDPVNITGATGSSGGVGQAGRSVKSIQEQYYLSTSPIDLENGSWLDNPPQWEEDKYIWTRSVITYENPSGVDRTDPVSVSGQQGPKGETGSDGKDAPLVKLSGQTQIIKVDNKGRLTPSTNFIVTASSVNTVITSWRYSANGGSFTTTPPVGVTRSGATITVDPNLVEFTTLTIRVGDGKVSDDFTIAKAVDGATGKDGEDAYTVILTNESHTFAGNIISAVPSSTTTDIVAYKGNLRVPVTIDSVTGNPEGMEYQISSNGTVDTRITFSVDENLVEESGTIKLNLVLGGQYITKEFSFAVAYKGERGEKGERGATGSRGPQGDEGVGISSVTEHYLISNQSTGVTYSTSGWGTSIPTMTPELRFLWNYEEIHFTDGTSEPTLPVVVGVYGQQGPKGSEGEDGRSIEKIEERYLATSSGSGVTRSTDGWKEEMQVTTPTKKYLWNYEIITWSKAPLKTYIEPIIIGIHGDKGDEGKGIKSQVVTYQNHSNGTTAPTGSWSDKPSPVKGEYLWTRTVTQYTEGNPITTYAVAYNALDGQRGATGGKGDEGTGISSTVIRYFQSTSGATTPTGSGATTPPTPIQGQYNWTKTVITYTDGTSSTAWSTSYNAKDGKKGDTGATGSTGPKGDAGKGIKEQTVTYQNHTNGTTAPTGTWTNSPNPVKGQYLWTRTVTTYTEGNPVTTYAVAYNATDGQKGSEGTGIKSTQVRYQQSTSGSATPTGTWQTSIPTPTKGRYLWTRTIITYTDGTTSTAYSTSYYATDGQKGDKGDTGDRGPQGPQGVSITKVDVEYAQNASSTSAPTSGWSTNAPTWKNGQYIWSRTKTTYSSGNPTYSKPACITGQKGSVGGVGNDGKGISSIVEQYYLSDSKETRTGGNWTTTVPKWEQGKYMWTRSQINWINPTGTTYTDPIVDSAWEAVQEGTKGIGLADKTEILSGTEIFTDKADDSVVHIEVDGKSVQEGEPSPDYPIEIHSLNDFDVVSSVGKRNLLIGRQNGNYRLSSNNGNTNPIIYKSYEDYDSVMLTDGNQLSTYSSERLTLEKGKEYTSSMYVYSPVKLDLSIIGYSGNVWTTVPANTWIRLSNTFIGTGENRPTIMLFSTNAEALNHEIFYNRIKLEEGEISSYSPAPEDITEDSSHPLIDKTNILLSEPLRSVGDVKDRLFKDSDGLWKIERNVGEVVIDGTRAWAMEREHFYTSFSSAYGGAKTYNYMTSHFNFNRTITDDGVSEGFRFGGMTNETHNGNLILYIPRFKTTSELRSFLDSSPMTVIFELEASSIETLDQELQEKLNNLRSFQDSNYVYTVINDKTDIISENLKPTLHATFKGGGWYSRWKTEDELERHQKEIDEKADTSITDEIQDKISDFVEVEDYREEIGEINSALQDYKAQLEAGEISRDEAISDIVSLMDRTSVVENNLGEFTEKWKFLDTSITFGNEGILVGDIVSDTGIRISSGRIDFVDNGSIVAEITGQLMKINRGIFVRSAQIGEHQIETIAGGHTIYSWIPN